MSGMVEAPLPSGLSGDDDENEQDFGLSETKPFRGFNDPAVREAAQATRAANREARIPVGLNGETLPPPKEPKSRAPRQKKETRSLEGIENMLISMHFMLATATGFDELLLEQSEAHTLADALAKVSDYYKIKLDGKTGAFMGLIWAIGMVYGPRAVTIGIKLRTQGANGKRS